jgi:hypothetical protein
MPEVFPLCLITHEGNVPGGRAVPGVDVAGREAISCGESLAARFFHSGKHFAPAPLGLLQGFGKKATHLSSCMILGPYLGENLFCFHFVASLRHEHAPSKHQGAFQTAKNDPGSYAKDSLASLAVRHHEPCARSSNVRRFHREQEVRTLLQGSIMGPLSH